MSRIALGGVVVAFGLAAVAAVVAILDGLGIWPVAPVVALGAAAVYLWRGQDLVSVLLLRLAALVTIICGGVYSSELGWFLGPAGLIAVIAALLASLDVRAARLRGTAG